MTNEEAYNIISEFCFTGYEDNKKPSAKLFNAIRELVCEVHENAEIRGYNQILEKESSKLKAEIEQLKERLEIKDHNFELYSDALDEMERLKAELKHSEEARNKQNDVLLQVIKQLEVELEYSTSLMPRMCETCEYEDEIGWKEPCNSCEHANNWKLKGKVEE